VSLVVKQLNLGLLSLVLILFAIGSLYSLIGFGALKANRFLNMSATFQIMLLFSIVIPYVFYFSVSRHYSPTWFEALIWVLMISGGLPLLFLLVVIVFLIAGIFIALKEEFSQKQIINQR